MNVDCRSVFGPDHVEPGRQVGDLTAAADDPVVLREQVLGFAGDGTETGRE
jgi:hypothetical protein